MTVTTEEWAADRPENTDDLTKPQLNRGAESKSDQTATIRLEIDRGIIAATIGLATILAGVLLQIDVLTVIGSGVVGAGMILRCIHDPLSVILIFLAIRPLLDLGPTYGWGPDLNSAAGGLLILALLVWGWRYRREFVRPSRSVLAALLFAVAAVLSVLGSFAPVDSALLAMRVLTIALIFGFAEQQQRRDSRTIWTLVASVLVSASLAGLVGAVQVLGVIAFPDGAVASFDSELLRPPGPYLAAPVFATHLYLGLIVLLLALPALWRSQRWRFLTLHALIWATGLLWLMLENRSRSPLLALAIAVALFAVLAGRWRGIAVWAVLGLAAVALIDPGTVRADELGLGADPGAEADTFAWRVSYWEQNLPRILDNPTTGIGLGRVAQLNEGGNPPHSTVVQTIVEMGLFGIATYAIFVLALLVDLLARIRSGVSNQERLVWIAALSLGLGYFLIGLSENLLTQVVTSGPIAVIMGAALAYAPARTEAS